MKIRSAIVCEMCRPEPGNKWTILGAVGGDILLSELPGTIQMSAYLEIEDVTAGNHTIKLLVNVPGAEVLVDGKFEALESNVVSLTLPQMAMQITGEGKLTMTLTIDEHSFGEFVRRKIILAKPTSDAIAH